MRQTVLKILTKGRAMVEITEKVAAFVEKAVIKHGLCHLFIKHTSASLLVCENADPEVREDLERFMSRLVVDGDPLFKHCAEGKDDMPAHIRSVLTQTSIAIPILDGQLALGTWQGIYLWEHRYQAHERNIVVSLVPCF